MDPLLRGKCAYHQPAHPFVWNGVKEVADGFVLSACQLRGSSYVALPTQVEHRLITLQTVPARHP